MNSTGQLSRLHNQYRDQVEFLFIYCREAHPIDGERPNLRKVVEDPVSNAERMKVAQQFVEEIRWEIPALLDEVDDRVSTAYAALPDRLYLVGVDGKIAYAGEKGPRGFKPAELEDAIRKELEKNR